MRVKSLIVGLATASALAAVLIAWRDARATAAARATLIEVARAREAEAIELRRAESQLAAATKERVALQAALDRAQKGGAKVPAAPAVSPPAAAPAVDEAAFAEQIRKSLARKNEPHEQARQLAGTREKLAASHGMFFRALGLSPEQISRFQEIGLKREADAVDLNSAAQAQGLAFDDPLIEKFHQRAQAELEAAQRELLGEAGYGRLQEFQRTVQVRDAVRGTIGAATVAGLSFARPEVEHLIDAIANASRAYREGGRVSPADIDWQVVDAQARTFLSEAQFRFFTTNEPPASAWAGGAFLLRWNGALMRAQEADKAVAPPASGPPVK